jgi:glycosyltransferase involved in cell wall biosynthesis
MTLRSPQPFVATGRRSRKPVVTCTDSGEASLLVEHERSGLVVAPDAKSIGRAFDRLHDDRAWATALGAAGATRAAAISWDAVVPQLAGALRLDNRVNV